MFLILLLVLLWLTVEVVVVLEETTQTLEVLVDLAVVVMGVQELQTQVSLLVLMDSVEVAVEVLVHQVLEMLLELLVDLVSL